jgi:hypothetical protein
MFLEANIGTVLCYLDCAINQAFKMICRILTSALKEHEKSQ